VQDGDGVNPLVGVVEVESGRGLSGVEKNCVLTNAGEQLE